MNKLLIITDGIETGQSLFTQLNSVFGDLISIKVSKLDQVSNAEIEKSLVLLTDSGMADKIYKRFGKNINYVTVKRLIEYSRLNTLLTFSPGTTMLLVNNREETCADTILELQEMGLKHIQFEKYYPGIEAYKPLSIAVSPGEGHLSPKCVKKIIDIGIRKIDIQTIIEIFTYFDMLETNIPLIQEQIQENKFELSNLFVNYFNELNGVFEMVVNSSEDCVAYINRDRNLKMFNKNFSDMVQIKPEELVNRAIDTLIPDFENLVNRQQTSNIIEIKDERYYVNLEDLQRNGEIIGYFIRLKNIIEIQKIDHDIRQNYRNKSGQAIYTYQSIIGTSREIIKTVELTKKMASGTSTIMLNGESGTGKEIFAQAIHNYSSRKKKPFVPVNFAAMTETLMESELFGYEDGAFTGAKKGGKIGLFEEAQEGSIFLDEIGDASVELQIRLLRTLQEKCIRRVGGTTMIPVDVRIIAATNKDLRKLVAEGKFREDLYYRINVIPIYVPSLRERPEDIRLLLDYYIKHFTGNSYLRATDMFNQDSLRFMDEYQWPGNIRELVNVVEYATNIFEQGAGLDAKELPFFHQTIIRPSVRKVIPGFSEEEGQQWVLEKLLETSHCGRRGLASIAQQEGISLSEAKIKVLLAQLEKKGLIKVQIGVEGCSLTSRGLEELNADGHDQ